MMFEMLQSHIGSPPGLQWARPTSAATASSQDI